MSAPQNQPSVDYLPHLPTLVDTWYPPSREHWELLNYAWQFFPLVRSTKRPILPVPKLTLTIVHCRTMAHDLLPLRQNEH